MEDHRYTVPTVRELPLDWQTQVDHGYLLGAQREAGTRGYPLPPARCERHAHIPQPGLCPACFRAQQLRLAAHNAASMAAARDWHFARAAAGYAAA